MRLMKMMDYDFKVANIWQYFVSEIIAYKLCIGYIRCFFIIVHHLHQTHHSSDRRITIQTMNHVYQLSVNLVQKMANDNLNSGHFGYTLFNSLARLLTSFLKYRNQFPDITMTINE